MAKPYLELLRGSGVRFNLGANTQVACDQCNKRGRQTETSIRYQTLVCRHRLGLPQF